MTPIVVSDTCACERNDWERRPGTDGALIVCRTCGYIGAVDEAPGTVSVHRVTLSLCSLCLTGAGGECHTPGCSLWMHRAPDTRVYVDHAPPPRSSERDALVIAALDEAAADRVERARGSGCPACAVQDYMRRGTQCDEHREHADRAAEYRAERDRLEAGR